MESLTAPSLSHSNRLVWYCDPPTPIPSHEPALSCSHAAKRLARHLPSSSWLSLTKMDMHAVFTRVPASINPQVQNGNRKCTDVLFLLMLCAAWAAMTMLGLIVTGIIPSDGLEPGNPKRLLNGIDYEGRICGVGTTVQVKLAHVRVQHATHSRTSIV